MTCILIVEDDDDVRETLCAVLATRGFNVVAACHGLDALEKIRRHGARPAVIVLDLMMPCMDGEEFLAVQGDEPLLAHVPVILETAQLDVPDPLPAVVKAVLAKPVRLGDLLLAIDRCRIDIATATPPLAHGTGAIPPIASAPALAPDENDSATELATVADPVARPASEPTE